MKIKYAHIALMKLITDNEDEERKILKDKLFLSAYRMGISIDEATEHETLGFHPQYELPTLTISFRGIQQGPYPLYLEYSHRLSRFVKKRFRPRP